MNVWRRRRRGIWESSEEAGVGSIWKFAFLVALVEIEITSSCQNLYPTLAVDS